MEKIPTTPRLHFAAVKNQENDLKSSEGILARVGVRDDARHVDFDMPKNNDLPIKVREEKCGI